MSSPLRGGPPAAEVAVAPPQRLGPQSPASSLKSALTGDLPITFNAIAAAQTAAASPGLLKQAFRKKKSQQIAPSPNPHQLQLDGATPKPKSKPVLHSALARLRQVPAAELPTSGDKRKLLKKKKARVTKANATNEAVAAAAAAAAAAATAAAASEGANKDDGELRDDEDSSGPGGSSTLKRKRGEHSDLTTKKFASAKTICRWSKPKSEGGSGHEWMTWAGGDGDGMKCATCLAEGKSGDAFSTEGGCTTFMVKELQRHEKNHHVEVGVSAKEATAEARSSLAASATEAGASNSAMEHVSRLAYMEQAYFLSKHPTCSDLMFKPLLSTLDRTLKRFGISASATHEKRHHHGAAQATAAFSAWLSARQLADILASPVIGIAGDESTDVSVTEQLALYIYYIKNGEVVAEYFEMKDLHGASAGDIKRAIIDSLNARAPGLAKKLIILDSDGCSVMFGIGKKGGVGKKLRAAASEIGEGALIEYLLQMHCVGHKLQLAVGEGLATPETRVIDRLLSSTYGIFKNSGQRREGLEKVYDEMIVLKESEGRFKQLKKYIAVRWLSRTASIDSIITPLDALVVFLHELKTKKGKKRPNEDDEDEDEDEEIAESGRMTLDELVAAYSDFQTVGMLHFLGDVCEQLSVTSSTLQGSELDIDVVLSNIDGLITSLKNDYPASGSIRWGPRMRKFIARCPTIGSTSPSDISIAGKHAIKVTAAKRDALYQAARDAAELVSIALNERMPDAAIITALLKLFDARALPTTIPAEYGDLELETVLGHFAPHAKAAESATKAAADPTNAELKADAARTSKRSEVHRGARLRRRRHDEKPVDVVQERHARRTCAARPTAPSTACSSRSESMSERDSELLKTGNVLVLIALSNAISERGYSLLNHAKTQEEGAAREPSARPQVAAACRSARLSEEGIEAIGRRGGRGDLRQGDPRGARRARTRRTQSRNAKRATARGDRDRRGGHHLGPAERAPSPTTAPPPSR